MRVVGGALSGRKLAHVGKGAPEAQLRPTSDRVRESVFNILAHAESFTLEGARVLDLFAGTGALGIEALSRGATRAVFVEEHPVSRALLRENIEALGLTGVTKVFRRDATRLGPNRGDGFTLVFLDPPYGRGLTAPALESASAGGWLAEGARVVVELGAEDAAPRLASFEALDERRYGETRIAFLAWRGASCGRTEASRPRSP